MPTISPCGDEAARDHDPVVEGRMEFADVSAQIRPETASLTAADISITEQNSDFDLASPHCSACVEKGRSGGGLD